MQLSVWLRKECVVHVQTSLANGTQSWPQHGQNACSPAWPTPGQQVQPHIQLQSKMAAPHRWRENNQCHTVACSHRYGLTTARDAFGKKGTKRVLVVRHLVCC